MIDNLFNVIGIIAAVLTTVSFLPQAIKVFRTKKTKDLSLLMLIAFFLGQIGWFIYGFFSSNNQIIYSSSITGLLTLYIVIMKIRLG